MSEPTFLKVDCLRLTVGDLEEALTFYGDSRAHPDLADQDCSTPSSAPVLLPFESYARTFDYIRDSGLPPEDIDLILNHNAQRVLGLPH